MKKISHLQQFVTNNNETLNISLILKIFNVSYAPNPTSTNNLLNNKIINNTKVIKTWLWMLQCGLLSLAFSCHDPLTNRRHEHFYRPCFNNSSKMISSTNEIGHFPVAVSKRVLVHSLSYGNTRSLSCKANSFPYVQKDSFWNRGKKELENGSLSHFNNFSGEKKNGWTANWVSSQQGTFHSLEPWHSLQTFRTAVLCRW